MVIYNAATRELTAKIVYYGPGLGGKTTNLQLLHERLEPATVGKLLNLATQTDRTIYFDLLPVELGDIKGYKIRFQLATVPGQTAFNETRRVVLKGTDGIVFVADSQWTMLPKNLESWQNLKDNLRANGVSFEGIPIVIQYNKRDLTDILSVDALQEALGLTSYPFVEAVASAGRGVTETFKLISKLTFVDLLRRLQGRRPDEAGAASTRREPDDLLSWKDSLLNRAASPSGPVALPADTGTGSTRPLTLVPALPEEPPFAAAEEPAEASVPAEADAPFGDSGATRAAAPPEAIESPAPPAAAVPPPSVAPAAPVRPPFEELALPQMPEIPPILAGWEPESAQARAAAPPPPPEAAVPPAPAPEIAALTDDTDARLRALEARIDEAFAAVAQQQEERLRAEQASSTLHGRLDAVESLARSAGRSLDEKHQAFADRIERMEKDPERSALAGRISELHDRLGESEKRQRTSEDDVSLALRSFGERGEKLHQQVAAIASQIEVLEAALREKTAQSRREADDIRSEIQTIRTMIDEKIGHSRRESEDIRTQIAPLLEAHGQRAATDERLAQEFERLRESIADSLGDLSERLRRAVRGL